MIDAFTKIRAMHEHFGIGYNGKSRFLDLDEQQFRLVALREELQEFVDAYEESELYPEGSEAYWGCLDEAQDALVDLIVFALGTAERMGLRRIDEGFDRVWHANMQKRVADHAGESKRDFHLDLVKPEGWIAPTHFDLLDKED